VSASWGGGSLGHGSVAVDAVAWARSLGVSTGEALAVEVDAWARRAEDVAEQARALIARVSGLPEAEVSVSVAVAEQQLRDAASHLRVVVERAVQVSAIRVESGRAS
jgi:hypothetical protein